MLGGEIFFRDTVVALEDIVATAGKPVFHGKITDGPRALVEEDFLSFENRLDGKTEIIFIRDVLGIPGFKLFDRNQRKKLFHPRNYSRGYAFMVE